MRLLHCYAENNVFNKRLKLSLATFGSRRLSGRESGWDGDAVRPEDVDWLNEGAAMMPSALKWNKQPRQNVHDRHLAKRSVLVCHTHNREVARSTAYTTLLYVTTLRQVFFHTCACHRAIQFGTRQRIMMRVLRKKVTAAYSRWFLTIALHPCGTRRP